MTATHGKNHAYQIERPDEFESHPQVSGGSRITYRGFVVYTSPKRAGLINLDLGVREVFRGHGATERALEAIDIFHK